MNNLQKLKKTLKALSNKKQAKILLGFFKTGKGEYGEGDIFYGIKVPVIRNISNKFSKELTIKEVEELLHSKIHEERTCALFILVNKFQDKNTTIEDKQKIFDTYISNTKWINNWDLVDLSSYKIIGKYIFENPKENHLFEKLAKSNQLWEKRISIISTFYFIKNNKFEETLRIAKILLKDEHDLMHKAVGWMLREVGKRNLKTEEDFLRENYKKMPRTMLRYAIEKFPEAKRKKYLNAKI